MAKQWPYVHCCPNSLLFLSQHLGLRTWRLTETDRCTHSRTLSLSAVIFRHLITSPHYTRRTSLDFFLWPPGGPSFFNPHIRINFLSFLALIFVPFNYLYWTIPTLVVLKWRNSYRSRYHWTFAKLVVKWAFWQSKLRQFNLGITLFHYGADLIEFNFVSCAVRL